MIYRPDLGLWLFVNRIETRFRLTVSGRSDDNSYAVKDGECNNSTGKSICIFYRWQLYTVGMYRISYTYSTSALYVCLRKLPQSSGLFILHQFTLSFASLRKHELRMSKLQKQNVNIPSKNMEKMKQKIKKLTIKISIWIIYYILEFWQSTFSKISLKKPFN
jgi:hypothetical protein